MSKYGRYQDVLMNDFSGGLNTKWEDNMLENNQTPDCKNVIFDGKGNVMPRKGVETFGTSASGSGGIYSTYVFKRANGTEIPIRSYDGIVDYYNSFTDDWAEMVDGFTASCHFGFAAYGAMNVRERVYFGNAVDKPHQWSGIHGYLSGSHAIGATVFYLSTTNALSTLGWLSANQFNLDGEQNIYASLSGNALSTCNAATVSHASQVPVCELPIMQVRTSGSVFEELSGRGMPRGNIYKVIQNRLHIGGVSSYPYTDFYSKIADPTDFTYSTPISAADGGEADFAEGGGTIKSYGVKEDTLIVFKPDVIRGMSFTSDDLPALTTVVDGLNVGAVFDSAEMVENAIFYINPLGQVKNLTRTQADMPLEVGDMSDIIKPTVNDLTVTSATSRYYNKKVYFTAQQAGSTFNDVILNYDSDYNAWTKWIGLNANSFFIYDKGLYYGASNEKFTYKMLTDYNDNGFAYEAYWRTKKLDYGIPNELKRCRFIYVEGYLTENQDLNFEIDYNDGASSTITKTIEGTGDYIDETDTIEVFGETTWGEGTYGGPASGTTTYLLRKFRVRLELGNVDFFNMQVSFNAMIDGSVFKVTHIAPYLMPLPSKKFNIDNQI